MVFKLGRTGSQEDLHDRVCYQVAIPLAVHEGLRGLCSAVLICSWP